jgi:hypothetical protein
MAEFHVHAAITPGDLDAAMKFIQKRARRRKDAAEGVCAALFACVYATAEGLLDCGLPADQIKRLLDQQTHQVMFQLMAAEGRAEGRS